LIIKWVEGNESEQDLRLLVQKCWDEVERDCEVRRKRRYE